MAGLLGDTDEALCVFCTLSPPVVSFTVCLSGSNASSESFKLLAANVGDRVRNWMSMLPCWRASTCRILAVHMEVLAMCVPSLTMHRLSLQGLARHPEVDAPAAAVGYPTAKCVTSCGTSEATLQTAGQSTKRQPLQAVKRASRWLVKCPPLSLAPSATVCHCLPHVCSGAATRRHRSGDRMHLMLGRQCQSDRRSFAAAPF